VSITLYPHFVYSCPLLYITCLAVTASVCEVSHGTCALYDNGRVIISCNDWSFAMLLLQHNTLKAGVPVHACSASSIILFSKGHSVLCVCRHVMQSRGQADMSHVGPRCNQQMHFEALEPLLAHSDARTHLAEVWSGEAADPQKVSSKRKFKTC
jgi:hypothetical protein